MRNNAIFYSEGSKIAAHLYLPNAFDAAKKYPSVVLCHGFAGIKEALVPPYAEGFAKNGFIVLAFDYRGFGESEGEPGSLIPDNQVTDIRNAITYISSLANVDQAKIGLWGSSFGGANAVEAAALDGRVRAVVAQLTFADGERVVTGGLKPEEKAKLLATLQKVWSRAVTSNKNMMMSLDQILTDADSKAFFAKITAEYPKTNVKIPFQFVRYSMEYKPEKYAKLLKCPLFVLGAEKDIVNPPAESKALYDAANEPKKLYMVKGATHYEVYSGAKFDEAFAQELAWFKRFL